MKCVLKKVIPWKQRMHQRTETRVCKYETSLNLQVKYFTDRSKAVLLLWIFYVFFLSSVCYAFVRVCLFVPCGHLLGKG